MRTIEQVNQEIQDIQKGIDFGRKNGAKNTHLSRLAGDLALLKTFRAYLETNPSEAFLLKEQARLTELLKVLDGRFEQQVKQSFPDREIPNTIKSKMLAEHRKRYDIPRLRNYLKTIKYLLG